MKQTIKYVRLALAALVFWSTIYKTYGMSNSQNKSWEDMENKILSNIFAQTPQDDIFKAVRKGNIKRVQQLLTENKDLVNTRDKNLWTPLLYACDHVIRPNNVDLSMIKFLVENGARVNPAPISLTTIFEEQKQKKNESTLNDKNTIALTPLQLVCEHNDTTAIAYLLSKGATVDGMNTQEILGPPLLLVCLKNNLPAIKLLLQHWARTNVFGAFWHTPLVAVCDKDNLNALKLLLLHRANPNWCNQGRYLIQRTCNNSNSQALALLMTAGVHLAESDLIHFPKELQSLVQKALPINDPLRYALNKTCMNPDVYAFLRAIKQGKIKKMTTIIKKRPKVLLAVNGCGCTALHFAVRFGKRTITEHLLDYGLDSNAEDRYGIPPIRDAIRNGNIDMIELLRKNGLRASSVKYYDLVSASQKNNDPNLVQRILSAFHKPGSTQCK
jgi:ankyrin repeat protein